MRFGSRGFALAKFSGSDVEIETEMPNMALPSEAPIAASPLIAAPPTKFRIMIYRKKNSVAIRSAEQSRKQLLCVSAKGKPLKALKSIATEAVQKLQAGESLESVKSFVGTRLKHA